LVPIYQTTEHHIPEDWNPEYGILSLIIELLIFCFLQLLLEMQIIRKGGEEIKNLKSVTRDYKCDTVRWKRAVGIFI
jgi:hypothetical protein